MLLGLGQDSPCGGCSSSCAVTTAQSKLRQGGGEAFTLGFTDP